ncbi:MAG: GDYXXLXY domain-containing protein [Rickettsiales bacterium]|jgi:hypothetical protein|nr:GDYXXLXY domain-containing protein [Rickettsiales bacterium]
MRKWLYLALALPVFALAGWIGLLERGISAGMEVRVAATGYDPIDPFRGHYVWLRLDWVNTDCAQFPDKICPKGEFRDAYKFYLNETRAEKVDEFVQSAARGPAPRVEMLFSYSPGSAPMVKALLLDGAMYEGGFAKGD